MSYASLFLGDSQTMTSEAAMLGVPSLRCNSLAGRLSTLEEEEHRYGLTFGFTPERFDAFLEKLRELVVRPDLKNEWNRRKRKMLDDKIDVTAYWTWFVDNYPESVEIMRRDPATPCRFR
jgi:uncharacterized protein